MPQPPGRVEPERQTPLPNRLVRHGDTPFSEETLHIPETQAEPVGEPDGTTDDLRGTSVSAGAGRLGHHRATLPGAAQLDNAVKLLNQGGLFNKTVIYLKVHDSDPSCLIVAFARAGMYRQPNTAGTTRGTTRLTGGALRVVALSLGLLAVAGPAARAQSASVRPGDAAAQAIVDETCQRCHNDRTRYGNMSLESFEVALADESPELAEKMIRKLRAGMMPPAGVRRPDETALESLATLLETRIDEAAAANPNPGRRTFQRLNRAEYERSVSRPLTARHRRRRISPARYQEREF